MPDNRRKQLYRQRLVDTRAYLRALVAPNRPLAAHAALLQPALTDTATTKALTALMGPLELLLDGYTAIGVMLDFRRLAPSKVLLRKDPTNPPGLDVAFPADGSVYAGDGAATDPNVTTAEAYSRYFKWYIDSGTSNTSRIDAFFARYPLLEHALEMTTANYKANIELACTRVATDLAAIQQAFFPGLSVLTLQQIQTTGSDFHKGGEQVLILTFGLSDNTQGRIVYKPSGVEIDCRIVGRSDVVKSVKPQGYSPPTDSLTEIMNTFNPPHTTVDGFKTADLPTYRILPYNNADAANAYGYIEYLTHLPETGVATTWSNIRNLVGAFVKACTPSQVASSDWIVDTTDPAHKTDGLVFFHQFGALMAMATAVSLSDLHLQNVIVHQRRPHLIDLEDALKRAMTSVTATGLAGSDESGRDPNPLANYHDPGSTQAKVTNDGTSKLDVSFRPPELLEPAKCVLYYFRGSDDPGRPASVYDPGTASLPGGTPERRALLLGLDDAVKALALPACNDEVKNWVNSLAPTLARYVSLPTSEYADALRSLYMGCSTEDVTSLRDTARAASDSWYNGVSIKNFRGATGFFFRGRVTTTWASWANNRGPYFALEHPDHAWRDYLNCDVPSFYHKLGDQNLLNSAGVSVNVKTAFEWQQTDLTLDGATKPNYSPRADGAYFDRTPVAVVVDQLEALKNDCATDDGRRTRVRVMLEGTGVLQSAYAAVHPAPGKSSET